VSARSSCAPRITHVEILFVMTFSFASAINALAVNALAVYVQAEDA
jgi:hypothetical protein